jgi:hypothetical protein
LSVGDSGDSKMKAMESKTMTSEQSDYLTWIFAGVSAVFTVLTGAITKLWLKTDTDAKAREAALMKENADIRTDFEKRLAVAEAKLDKQDAEVTECHKQREELRVEMVAFKTRLEIIETQMDCKVKP